MNDFDPPLWDTYSPLDPEEMKRLIIQVIVETMAEDLGITFLEDRRIND